MTAELGAGRTPKLYHELAEWWPLLSPPAHYVEEIDDLRRFLDSAPTAPPRTVLELGSGGGSVAHHLRHSYTLTLTDRSAAMLAVNRAVNPECEHALGDMRHLRLGRTFDAVLIHDAVMYAVTEADVRATLATVHAHCRPGGGVVLVPDHVRETFSPSTTTGGEDGPGGRGLRFLEWIWDPEPADTMYDVAYAFLLREGDGSVRVEEDRHRLGLFPRAAWLGWLEAAGFDGRAVDDSFGRTVLIGRRKHAG
jgi:SAM-dependent methyltransferase